MKVADILKKVTLTFTDFVGEDEKIYKANAAQIFFLLAALDEHKKLPEINLELKMDRYITTRSEFIKNNELGIYHFTFYKLYYGLEDYRELKKEFKET